METNEVKAERRPLAAIIKDMRGVIDAKYLEQRKQGGATLTYIPWHKAQALLTRFTNGFWHYEVTHRAVEADHYTITVRVSVEAEEGVFYREGTGIEPLSTTSYGDFQSNAESMAFRRACAHFGLGLYLYDKSR